MRRRFNSLLIVAILVLLISACGKQGTDNSGGDGNNGAIDLDGASDTLLLDVRCEGLRNDETTNGRRCVCLDAACTSGG